jgi:hypothetical protein
MYSIKVFTFLALLATGALAAPTPTESVNQSNVCGNGLQQYCCNDSNSCSPMGEIPAAFPSAFYRLNKITDC